MTKKYASGVTFSFIINALEVPRGKLPVVVYDIQIWINCNRKFFVTIMRSDTV